MRGHSRQQASAVLPSVSVRLASNRAAPDHIHIDMQLRARCLAPAPRAVPARSARAPRSLHRANRLYAGSLAAPQRCKRGSRCFVDLCVRALLRPRVMAPAAAPQARHGAPEHQAPSLPAQLARGLAAAAAAALLALPAAPPALADSLTFPLARDPDTFAVQVGGVWGAAAAIRVQNCALAAQRPLNTRGRSGLLRVSLCPWHHWLCPAPPAAPTTHPPALPPLPLPPSRRQWLRRGPS